MGRLWIAGFVETRAQFFVLLLLSFLTKVPNNSCYSSGTYSLFLCNFILIQQSKKPKKYIMQAGVKP